MDSTFQCDKEMTDSYSSRDSALIYWRLLIPKVQFKDFFVCMFGSDDFQPQCCISTPFNQLWQLWSLPYHHLLNHFEYQQISGGGLRISLPENGKAQANKRFFAFQCHKKHPHIMYSTHENAIFVTLRIFAFAAHYSQQRLHRLEMYLRGF